MKEKNIRIAITGGGSGGHLYPLVSIVQALRKNVAQKGRTLDIRYFGNPGLFAFLLESNGIKIYRIVSSRWRAYADVRNFFDIFKFLWSLPQALWTLFWFMPDVCFSKGGPGALSVILASRFFMIPIIIHESDTIPGKTTMHSAKKARIIELGFASAGEYLPKTKAEVHVVGSPVREEIQENISLEYTREEFGLNADMPVILFIGGSQGARRINTFVLEHIQALTDVFQVLHQTGAGEFAQYKKEYEFMVAGNADDIGKRYKFYPYFQKNIAQAYIAADIVISRAGANTIFEIATLGKPSILIPLPESAHGHQWQNARAYADTGAAIIIEEENLLVNVFLTTIKKILEDKDMLEQMKGAAKKFTKPDSARHIAEDILTLV